MRLIHGAILSRLDRLIIVPVRTAISIRSSSLSLVLATWLALAGAPAAAQGDNAVLLVANPGFRDLDYRQTVLIAGPLPSGGHIGVILNRPTRRPLASLFPEHEPSKKVIEPVYYGGPFSRNALVALVKSRASPGEGSVQLLDDLYLAFRASTIDHVIETEPNSARYFVGYVGWQPGELKSEIERGLWSVLGADAGTALKKDTDRLWEDLLRQSQRLRASWPAGPVALLPGR